MEPAVDRRDDQPVGFRPRVTEEAAMEPADEGREHVRQPVRWHLPVHAAMEPAIDRRERPFQIATNLYAEKPQWSPPLKAGAPASGLAPQSPSSCRNGARHRTTGAPIPILGRPVIFTEPQ